MALSTVGTCFLVGDGGSPELFSDLAQLTSISGPSTTVTMIDSSDLKDTHMERVAGLIESGDVSLTINWDPDVTTHDTMRGELTGRESANYAAIWPTYGGSQVAISSVNTTSEVVTTGSAHGLITGQTVQFSTDNTLPDPLQPLTTYYVNVATADTFTVHTTNAAAIAGTGAVNLTDTGTGSHNVDLPARWTFAGFVSSYAPGADTNDKLTATITVTVTGSVTS
jgi:hypothetical protein